MASAFPSTHYACPCSDLTAAPALTSNKRASIQPAVIELSEEQACNPHSARANYALYPLEQLLYCDECDAIRCPRCWTEEVLYWYCPSCLFEVPSSAVRSDGNRCSRSCYKCPSCTSPLIVTQISSLRDEGLLKPSDAAGGNETYTLQCHFCEWSSLEIGVQFNKATKIAEQLAKQRRTRPSSNNEENEGEKSSRNHDDAFANLTAFYKEQLSESSDGQNGYSSTPYSSPANLARIVSLYGGLSHHALKKSREKPQPMREALAESEGLTTYSPSESDANLIEQMQTLGWEGTTSLAQRLSAPTNNDAKFTSQLWPAATPLRTRRGRRCRTCRQFLARPEQKVGSTRYKIRLLALNHIPRLSIRPLNSPAPTNPALALRSDIFTPEPLQPHQTKQYLLTIRNPLFDSVKITLATPATTPGKIASRITILCPSFTVGPAGELWDDALAAPTSTETPDGGRKAAMASLTGSSEGTPDRQPEAGKIWARTRNSTSVVLEIIPGSVAPLPSIVPNTDSGDSDDDQDNDEDANVLQVPIYVRAEWEAETKPDESVALRKDAEKQAGEKVTKEVGFWAVLNVGTIAS